MSTKSDTPRTCPYCDAALWTIDDTEMNFLCGTQLQPSGKTIHQPDLCRTRILLNAARAELAHALESLAMEETNCQHWHGKYNDASAELAALKAEQGTPLDRPDKVGDWWQWAPLTREWIMCHITHLDYWPSGKWLPAVPPRNLREGES